MKILKKIMVLVACVSVLLIGCTNSEEATGENAIQKLNRAIAKTDDATHTTGKSIMGLEILSDTDENMYVRVDMDFILNNLADTKTGEAKVVMETDNSGMKDSITMYCKDGYMYTAASGQKVKTKLDEEDDSVTETTKLQSFGKSNMEDLTIEKDGTNQKAKVKLKDDVVKEFIADRLTEALSGIVVTDDMIELDTTVVEYRIDTNGYVDTQDLSFSFTLKQNTQELKMKLYYKNTYSSFMKKSIDFPDFSDYEEQ
ncbi:hypothetical protein [Breznakia blatticola]|nr:hypothetical protein [Breznakia blatticola]